MNTIYSILGTILPFEAYQFTFMKNAFLAILLLTPLLGLLGTMAVNHQMAFFSDALGHSALTGIGLGIILGLRNDLAAMLIFGIIWAVLICLIKQSGSASTDTVISVFSSTSVAAGLLILARGGKFAKYSSLLIGDILAVTPQDLFWLLIALYGFCGFFYSFFIVDFVHGYTSYSLAVMLVSLVACLSIAVWELYYNNLSEEERRAKTLKLSLILLCVTVVSAVLYFIGVCRIENVAG